MLTVCVSIFLFNAKCTVKKKKKKKKNAFRINSEISHKTKYFFKPNMCPRAQSIIALEANRFMKITGPNKLIKYIPKMIIMIKVNE